MKEIIIRTSFGIIVITVGVEFWTEARNKAWEWYKENATYVDGNVVLPEIPSPHKYALAAGSSEGYAQKVEFFCEKKNSTFELSGKEAKILADEIAGLKYTCTEWHSEDYVRSRFEELYCDC